MKPIRRAAFLAHAQSRRFAKLLAETENVLREFFEACLTPCISMSFGKDSLVMLDIARRIKPDVLCIHCDRGDGGDTDEIKALKARLHAEWNLNLMTAHTEISAFEAFKRGVNIRDYLIKAMNAAQVAHGVDGVAMGLTYDESNTRRRTIFGRGLLWRMADGLIRCYPIGHWRTTDVWAYIVSRDVPYPAVYDALEDAGVRYESKMSRTSNIIGLTRAEDGRLQAMQHCDASARAFFASLPDDMQAALSLRKMPL